MYRIVFYYFFVSVESHFVYVIFSWFCYCLSVCSCSLLCFLKAIILNFCHSIHKSPFLWGLVLDIYNIHLVVSCFLDFLCSLNSCICCLHIWRGGYLLQSLVTGFRRELPSAITPARGFEASTDLFQGYACPTLLVPSWGRDGGSGGGGGILKVVCLLSISQIQARCYEPVVCFFLGSALKSSSLFVFSQSQRAGLAFCTCLLAICKGSLLLSTGSTCWKPAIKG